MLSGYIKTYNELRALGRKGKSEESRPFGSNNKSTNLLYKKYFEDLQEEYERCFRHATLYDDKFGTHLLQKLKSSGQAFKAYGYAHAKHCDVSSNEYKYVYQYVSDQISTSFKGFPNL